MRASKWLWTAGIFFLLFAFLSRAAFAAGYMPGGVRDGDVFLVEMCGAPGTHEVVAVEIPGGPDTDDSEDAADMSKCPFAMSMASVLPSPEAVHAAVEAHDSRACALHGTSIVGAHDAWRAHAPPTGPPALI